MAKNCKGGEKKPKRTHQAEVNRRGECQQCERMFRIRADGTIGAHAA